MTGAIAGGIIGSRFEGREGPPPDFALFHRDCQFTDDTVCALAIAEALLGAQAFAASLRAFVRRPPFRGYGSMFLHWAMTDGAPAYGSWGNGAPMRVAAVGWLVRDAASADALAGAQAAVSHGHPDAVAASKAVARAILLLRDGGGPSAVRAHIAETFAYDLSLEAALSRDGFDVSAAGTVPPALRVAFEADDWECAVRAAVCLGGDTGTLACIAGAAAEAIHGVPPEIAAQARACLTADLLRGSRCVRERAGATDAPVIPALTQGTAACVSALPGPAEAGCCCPARPSCFNPPVSQAAAPKSR